MTDATLVVSEVFGPTFQGEGRNAGQRVAFVRTGGCNLTCSWCDTAYTWDAERFDLRAELSREPVDAIVSKLLGCDPQRVVISGGEPLLHQKQPGWNELLHRLHDAELPVEVETNGTIPPTPITANRVDQFNVSPKLAHAGDPAHKRIKPEVLWVFAKLAKLGNADLKIVVQNPGDVRRARDLAEQVRWPRDRVWVMPEAEHPADLLMAHRFIADAALAEGVNFTTRLHVLTWGTERGR